MPTDMVRAFMRRRASDRTDFWHQTALIAGISLAGGILTIARALQSDAFETALLVSAMVE
jgi:hypothetical protein